MDREQEIRDGLMLAQKMLDVAREKFEKTTKGMDSVVKTAIDHEQRMFEALCSYVDARRSVEEIADKIEEWELNEQLKKENEDAKFREQ